jgi:hypothetical protein
MYTGRMLEADFLGEVNIKDPRYLARARELGITEDGYLPDREAMILAKEFQPWQDVTVPEKDLPRDLRLEVFELLLEKGLVKRGQEDRVKIYTSVGTPFDYKHGIDTFLELEDEKGNIIARVTLDITQREEKIKTGGKADIIFSELPDPKNENERYLRAIDDLAKDAVELLAHRRKAALRQMPETQPEARA